MEVIVKKWGNSAAVRIPAAVMETAKFALEQPVDIRAEDGRVVIEPINKKEYDIEQLIKSISTENSHSIVDFGKPEGNEVW